MFSLITNIYNKKTKGLTLMGFFTATEKLKKFFLQLEMFDVFTTGDTAHIDAIFKFLPYKRQRTYGPSLPHDLAGLKARVIAAVKNIDAPMLTGVWKELEYRFAMFAVSPVMHTSDISRCKQKLFQFFCGCEQFH
jgi:hypothetical protein